MLKILRLVFSSGIGNSIFLVEWGRLNIQRIYKPRKMLIIIPVDPTRPDEGRVQCLNSVCSHNHLFEHVTVCIQTGFMEGFCWGAPLKTQYLSFSPVVKAIQLVEKLQHCPLNLALSTTVTLIPGQYFHT